MRVVGRRHDESDRHSEVAGDGGSPPMVAAFFHAREMLHLAISYGEKFEESDLKSGMRESGWATLAYLFGHR